MSRSSTAKKLESLTLDDSIELNSLVVPTDNSSDTSASTEDADISKYETSAKALDATQLYLGEIGYSPLLTAEEEVLYACCGLMNLYT